MAELILHHFAQSPFAEKIRLMLGFKQLVWKEVHLPLVMPKPKLLALTGGYRRTPVLQMGADIYCDTSLIAQIIDDFNQNPMSIHPHAMRSRVCCHNGQIPCFFLPLVVLIFNPEVLSIFLKK